MAEMLQNVTIRCPHCGESICIVVDGSAGDQQYIEDCQVCCRPIEIAVSWAQGWPEVRVADA